jgi:1,4-dihydroxy-2-naphthoyl-CoA hydrolase
MENMDFNKNNLGEWNKVNANSLMGNLGIEYLKVEAGYVVGRMPVDHRTKQPFGQLHGGATLALIETMAGVGSSFIIDLEHFEPRGINISANLLRSVEEGFVYCHGTIINKGERSHLWKFEVKDDEDNLIAYAQFTVVVVAKK